MDEPESSRDRVRDRLDAPHHLEQLATTFLERERTTAARGWLDAEGVLGELREQLTDWHGMLRQETGAARHALRALLAGA